MQFVNNQNISAQLFNDIVPDLILKIQAILIIQKYIGTEHFFFRQFIQITAKDIRDKDGVELNPIYSKQSLDYNSYESQKQLNQVERAFTRYIKPNSNLNLSRIPAMNNLIRNGSQLINRGQSPNSFEYQSLENPQVNFNGAYLLHKNVQQESNFIKGSFGIDANHGYKQHEFQPCIQR
ncbi:hypothetical protein ABPG74_009259 [Tetrahymena malaccensis]